MYATTMSMGDLFGAPAYSGHGWPGRDPTRSAVQGDQNQRAETLQLSANYKAVA
jgi:hypothetical protein